MGSSGIGGGASIDYKPAVDLGGRQAGKFHQAQLFGPFTNVAGPTSIVVSL
jgi:hypothetical protein